MDVRKLVTWAACAVLAILAAVLLLSIARKQPEIISLQALASEIRDGQITTIAIARDVLHAERADGSKAVVYKEHEVSFVEALTGLGITPGMMNEIEIRVMAPGRST
jgi:anti-sigma-K factor RskA